MATEEELPEELVKLKISTILPQIKLIDINIPVQLNPFYDRDLKDAKPERSAEQNSGALIMKPSQSLVSNRSTIQNCRRCRYRRASESVLDELKHVSSSTTSDSAENARTPSSGLLKQTLKKPTSSSVGGSGNRKVLLREPVLKALQTCLHPHSNVRRKLLVSAGATKTADGNDSPLTTKGISDFRDLIDECRNLLSEDVDFSGRLNQLCLSNRNSKNFTTIQTSKIQNNKSRKNRKPILNAATLSLSSSETTTSGEGHNDATDMPLIQPSILCSGISSSNLQQRNTNNSSPEQVSNHARYNTTCSQQAGNSAAAAVCDDVTIDELASYFDTFVHIPKKMSTMAEMMYI